MRAARAIPLEGQCHLRGHARSEVFVFLAPHAFVTDDLVADHAQVPSESAHRHVQQRADVQWLEVDVVELARTRVRVRIIRRHDELFAQRVEIGRAVRAMQESLAQRLRAGARIPMLAADVVAHLIEGPQADAVHAQRGRRRFQHACQRGIQVFIGFAKQQQERAAIVGASLLRRPCADDASRRAVNRSAPSACHAFPLLATCFA
jgi:hypothetical protein